MDAACDSNKRLHEKPTRVLAARGILLVKDVNPCPRLKINTYAHCMNEGDFRWTIELNHLIQGSEVWIRPIDAADDFHVLLFLFQTSIQANMLRRQLLLQ